MVQPNNNKDHNSGAEFQPSKPGTEPLTTTGHQPGQLVGNDAAPEFHAKTLPAGSAPSSRTFESNPENEVPGQADNTEAMKRSQGKESTYSDPLDMPGATSGDVHTGLGHPGQGQTSNELRHDGEHTNKRQPQTTAQEGGSGLTGEPNAEARRLMTDKTDHGPITGHGADRMGAEDKEPVHSEQLASEQPREQQQRDTKVGASGNSNVDKA